MRHILNQFVATHTRTARTSRPMYEIRCCRQTRNPSLHRPQNVSFESYRTVIFGLLIWFYSFPRMHHRSHNVADAENKITRISKFAKMLWCFADQLVWYAANTLKANAIWTFASALRQVQRVSQGAFIVFHFSLVFLCSLFVERYQLQIQFSMHIKCKYM